jgi:hypothetical protein
MFYAPIRSSPPMHPAHNARGPGDREQRRYRAKRDVRAKAINAGKFVSWALDVAVKAERISKFDSFGQ